MLNVDEVLRLTYYGSAYCAGLATCSGMLIVASNGYVRPCVCLLR